MSYLNAVRLHFAGQFQTNVSTVNNDPVHFRNSTFQPSFQWQEGQDGRNFNPPNGWFNPEGDGGFRLLGCKVTAAWTRSGPVGADDPVLSSTVGDSNDRACGKIVDLDLQQQLVSEIWGLQIRIADRHGENLFTGDFLEAPFFDLWDRAALGGGGDSDGGAAYQSTLQNLVWGEVSRSPFLTQLKALVESESARTGSLSIKFNLDGINLDFRSPNFMCGRIAGTIGPGARGEPRHMLLGRHFMAYRSQSLAPPKNFFYPAGSLNFCAAVLDHDARSLYLDLGNALPTTVPGGPMFDLGDLKVYAMTLDQGPVPLGSIPSQGAQGYASEKRWYEGCAGVVGLPLSAAQLAAAAISPLTISGGVPNSFISEASGGGYVRADRYVYRLTPGDSAGHSLLRHAMGPTAAGFRDQIRTRPVGTAAWTRSVRQRPSPAYLDVAVPADAITSPRSRRLTKAARPF